MHLGYRAVEDRGVWSIADPHGESMGAYRTEERAWNSQRHLEWASNLNAAAALDFGGHTVQIDIYSNSVTAKVLREDGGIMIYEVAANMARAITEAWALYRDAMESREAET